MLRLPPDVMEALAAFQRETAPDQALDQVALDLLIVGMSRSAETGLVESIRRREVRNVRKWAFGRLAMHLKDMAADVDEQARALTEEADAEDPGLNEG